MALEEVVVEGMTWRGLFAFAFSADELWTAERAALSRSCSAALAVDERGEEGTRRRRWRADLLDGSLPCS